MTPFLLTALVTLEPRVAVSQTADQSADTTAHTMVRAAGMPLQDGALEPGTLTVRIVRGDFSGDISGQNVDLQVIGGRLISAQTGQDGRAQFQHLAVGAQVHISTVVDGERLESETFSLPVESGVRILLVAGGSGKVDSRASMVPTPFSPAPAAAAESPTVVSAADASENTVVTIIKTVLACTTLFTISLIVLRHRRGAS